MAKPRLYLDICAIKRPWDRQTQVQIRVETLAIESILKLCEAGKAELVFSSVHVAENARNTDVDRREAVDELITSAGAQHVSSTDFEERVRELCGLGFAPFDAAHAAAAEELGAVFFVTCDKRFLRLMQRHCPMFFAVPPQSALAGVSS